MTIEPGRYYRNMKTGDPYEVLHLATVAWDTTQKLVVYKNYYGVICVRSLTEFSKKFEEVDG